MTDQEEASLLYLLAIVGVVALSPYIYAIYVCFKKGKDGFAWLGIARLLLPILD